MGLIGVGPHGRRGRDGDAVSNRVSRRQANRWAQKDQAAYARKAVAPRLGRAADDAGRAEGLGHPDRCGLQAQQAKILAS